MENLSLIESFSEFKDEKMIDRVTLMVILEEVFRNTLKRKYGSDENFDIIINPDKGDLEIWRNRIVVKDGEVEDENSQISLSDAQKIEPEQSFISIAVAPPHLQKDDKKEARFKYEDLLRRAGADKIISCTEEIVSKTIYEIKT